ncbi:unnamed protein product, partial [Adineta steineri]
MDEEEKRTILIFEMCHLPLKTSIIYPQVQQLMDTIFHPSKTFLTWGDGANELLKFKIYQLFQTIPVTTLNFINIQDRFKHWYNNTYKHNDYCYVTLFNDIADDPDCTCSHRPYKNAGDKWSLQKAIAIIFPQFLDKSLTRSNWGTGLDIRLYQNINFDIISYNVQSNLTNKQEQDRLKLVEYITDDCHATIILAFTIGEYLIDLNNNMEYFNDIFDVPDDLSDNDDHNDTEDLNKILEEYRQDFDFNYLNTNVDHEEMIIEQDDITTNDNQ